MLSDVWAVRVPLILLKKEGGSSKSKRKSWADIFSVIRAAIIINRLISTFCRRIIMCRKLICLLTFIVVLGTAGNASAGLVGYWRLDEGSGTIAYDSSGNGHDGELIGNPEWVTGYFGGGLEFAGSPDKVDVDRKSVV